MSTRRMPGSYSPTMNDPRASNKHSYSLPVHQQTQKAYQSSSDHVASDFYDNATGKAIDTDIVIYAAIKDKYPDLEVIDIAGYQADILGYINSAEGSKYGSATRLIQRPSVDPFEALPKWAGNMNRTIWYPPARRMDGGSGGIAQEPVYDQFLIKYSGAEILLYLVTVNSGAFGEGPVTQYMVTSEPGIVYNLIKAAGMFGFTLHDEIWVFDSGYWQKDAMLYSAIQKSRWEDIILASELKEDLLKTVLSFFDKKDVYTKLRVPWKRGLIFYGPPGNGKTITIKATMKTLQDRKESIPTLYVKSLKSFGGSEYSITQIFRRARAEAPCYLVFEDIDSLVSDDVRSFFLNAVDGLSENDGILMIGSTNHLERLDPGIAKRPSRFDRKYLFPDPNLEQRTAYCKFWQGKLHDNKDIRFPDKLCEPIAKLMDKFSFAYMQEAFVSTLLKIATDGLKDEDVKTKRDAWEMIELVEELGGGDEAGLNKYMIYREIKVQIKNLKEELEKGGGDDE